MEAGDEAEEGEDDDHEMEFDEDDEQWWLKKYKIFEEMSNFISVISNLCSFYFKRCMFFLCFLWCYIFYFDVMVSKVMNNVGAEIWFFIIEMKVEKLYYIFIFDMGFYFDVIEMLWIMW